MILLSHLLAKLNGEPFKGIGEDCGVSGHFDNMIFSPTLPLCPRTRLALSRPPSLPLCLSSLIAYASPLSLTA